MNQLFVWSAKVEGLIYDLFSRTHRVTLIGFWKESTWAHPFQSGSFFTTDQTADMLTIGTFTTSLWKCFMRLFDIRPPTICVSVIAAVFNLLALFFKRSSLCAMSYSKSSQLDFESGPWDETTKTPCKVVRQNAVADKGKHWIRPR